MPTETPAPVAPLDNSRACVLSLEEVDALNDAAHRIYLYGTLTANILEDRAVQDVQLEALLEIVGMMIQHATTIEQVMEQGCADARKAGA